MKKRNILLSLILILFLISCKSEYKLNLDNISLKFKDMEILRYIDDDLEKTEKIKIDSSEKINQITKLLENNLNPSENNDGLDSAPSKDSLKICFDDCELLLIKDNFYKDKYYYTFYYGGTYKNLTSDIDLNDEICKIIEPAN